MVLRGRSRHHLRHLRGAVLGRLLCRRLLLLGHVGCRWRIVWRTCRLGSDREGARPCVCWEPRRSRRNNVSVCQENSKEITYLEKLVDIHLDGQWFDVCVERSNKQHGDDDAVGDAVAVSRPATRSVCCFISDWPISTPYSWLHSSISTFDRGADVSAASPCLAVGLALQYQRAATVM